MDFWWWWTIYAYMIPDFEFGKFGKIDGMNYYAIREQLWAIREGLGEADDPNPK